MKRDGRSVLDIRPLSWSADGWPIAGDHPAVTTDAAAHMQITCATQCDTSPRELNGPGHRMH